MRPALLHTLMKHTAGLEWLNRRLRIAATGKNHTNSDITTAESDAYVYGGREGGEEEVGLTDVPLPITGSSLPC